MKRNPVMTILTVACIFSVIALTIAYAALRTSLTIEGTATVDGKWQVEFENLSSPTITGILPGDIKEAKLSATMFNLIVELGKPRDSVIYTFDVVNKGNIDAKISSITTPNKETLENNDLSYSFTYFDKTDANGNIIETPIVVGDTLMVGEKRKLKLSIKYNEIDSLNQPNPIQLNLDSSIVYGQL